MPHDHMTCLPTIFAYKKSIDSRRARTRILRIPRKLSPNPVGYLNHLHPTHPGKRIGHGGLAVWPPRSPELITLDFFFWDHVKSLMDETLVATRADLTPCIVVASADIASQYTVFV
ncbi:hypothetical protein TNCV_853161 [Trichonephila clavipes]|nr:hypothetical protein TNCV_853161 [Trichonephila clavipes]